MPNVSQAKVLANVVFQADPDWKWAVDVAIKQKRSSLRREATLALSERLGIPAPPDMTDGEESDAAA